MDSIPAIIKSSELTMAGVVYRGMSRGLLPQEFWTRTERGRKEGVEFGFMSTTTNRAVVVHYSESGVTPTVLEMHMGMIDRGVDHPCHNIPANKRFVLLHRLPGKSQARVWRAMP